MNWREPAAWSHGLAAIGWLALALWVARRTRRDARLWAVVVGAVLAAIAAVAGATLALYEDPLAWQVHRAFHGFAGLIWLAVLGRLLAPIHGARPGPVVRRVAVAAVALAAALLPVVSPYGLPTSHDGVWGQIAMASTMAVAVLGLVLIEQVVRASAQDARWSLKPLLVGIGAVFVFDLLMFAEAFLSGLVDRDLWAVSALVGLATVPLFAIASTRSRGWRLDLALSRSVVYHSTALLAAGIYLLLMAAAGYLVRLSGGDWGRVLQVALVALGLVAFVLLVFSGSARAWLRVVIGKHFFVSRFDHREQWMRVSRRLAEASQGDLATVVIRTMADTVESSGGALWLRRGGLDLEQVARLNAPEVAARVEATDPLYTFLRESGWVVDLNEARTDPSTYSNLVLPAWLEPLSNAWLIVPLASGRDLLGFVLLQRPRTAIDVDWEVRDLLKAVAQHAASHLANAAATERLLEASKFDAFNRMSAFVVHDIKNLVAQLSLVSRNAERHMQNPEFQADLLSTIQNVTQRMTLLLAQLRAGTTPVANAGPVDLASIVREVVRERVAPTPPVKVRLPERLMVLGHADRFERVVRNLIVNAQDATRDGSPVSVEGGVEGDRARLVVVDRGVGMSPDFIRDRLFRPFTSTKPNGMGIGAYESNQYVRELGGSIEVRSAEGEGTHVEVRLPLADARDEDQNPGQSVQRAA